MGGKVTGWGGRSGFRPDPLASFSLFCSLLCLSIPLIPLASVLCISWFELELALGVQLRASALTSQGSFREKGWEEGNER